MKVNEFSVIYVNLQQNIVEETTKNQSTKERFSVVISVITKLA